MCICVMCAHVQQERYCAQYPATQLLGWERVCELVFKTQRPSHPPGGAKSAAVLPFVGFLTHSSSPVW